MSIRSHRYWLFLVPVLEIYPHCMWILRIECTGFAHSQKNWNIEMNRVRIIMKGNCSYFPLVKVLPFLILKVLFNRC